MEFLISNKLKEHRLKLGLRQIDVATKLGMISSDRISRWEKGLAYPHIVNLFRIAELFQVLPHDLYPNLMKTGPGSAIPPSLQEHWIAERSE